MGITTDFESVYRRFESYRPSSVGEGEVMPDYVTPVTWLAAPELLPVSEAARLAGLTPELIRWLVKDGDIDAQEVGGELLIEKASLSEWLEALEDLACIQAVQAAKAEE